MRFLLLLFIVPFIGQSQSFPDWATHIGHKTKDVSYDGFAVDNDENIYVYGNDSRYFDFNPTHDTGTFLWDGQSTFADLGYYISCYDSLGNFKWVTGFESINSTSLPIDVNKIIFDDSNNMYIFGVVSSSVIDFDFDTSVYTLPIPPSTQLNYIAAYTPNQKLKYVYTLPLNQSINDAKISGNSLWLTGGITDSGYISFKNDSVLYHNTDSTMPNYLKSDGYIAKYSLNLDLLSYKIFASDYQDMFNSFDVDGNKLLVNLKTGFGIGTGQTDTIQFYGDSVEIDYYTGNKILLFDTLLNLDTVLIESLAATTVFINVNQDGYFVSENHQILSRFEFSSLGMKWNNDTAYHLYSVTFGSTFSEEIYSTHLDEEGNFIFHGAYFYGTKLYNGLSDTTYTPLEWANEGIFKIDLDSIKIAKIDIYNPDNHSVGIQCSGDNIYLGGWFASDFNLDNNQSFIEYAELGGKKNILLGRYTDVCRPITFNSYLSDTTNHCGFTSGLREEITVEGSGLRYQWYQDSFPLTDAEYTAGGYYYQYFGVNTPYLTTTLPDGGTPNSTDTLPIYCEVTSLCQADTQSQTFYRVVISEPTLYTPFPNDHYFNAGDTANLILNYTSDYPVTYLWYHNGIPLFNNSVYKNSDSASLFIQDIQWYNGGVYNIEVAPAHCPDLVKVSNDYKVHIATASINELQGGLNVKLYPNPIQNELSIMALTPDIYIEKIIIYNSLGQVVYEKNKQSFLQKETVQLSYLPKGNYFVELKSKNDSKKLMFNKL